jgi:CHAT domain-containing protein
VYYPRFIERHDLYLKFGASESEYIQTLTGGDLFSSDSLSKYKFQATSSNYQIIHLVTHAKYNSEAQKLSYVQFNETAQAESQYLYLDEIKSLDLKCDLVCLSACETGKGATYQSEGLKSLARNFIIAGSQSVVSSLWNVSDQTTSEIMQSFYKYLYDKKDKSEALALAKRDYLNNHREDELHPYYWAGMVLVGHDAAIFKSEDTNILFYLFIFFAIAFILFLLLKRKLFY